MRTNYWINPKFQVKFIAYTSLVSLGFMVVALGSVNYFFWEFQQRGLSLGLDENHVFFIFLEQQQRDLNGVLLSLIGVACLGMVLWGMKMSHRIAGPLYRLHTHMRGVAAGEVTHGVKFRKGDFFLELADAYNDQYDYITGNKKAEMDDATAS